MISPLHRAGGGRSSTAVAVISALILASCGTANAPSASPVAAITGPPAGATDLSVADTAKALGDPAHAVNGVWSVASHLQIGVYSIDDRELLRGAQAPSDSTLFLYDFEIDLLSRLTSNGPDTWDEFAARLTAWDPSLAFTRSSLQKAIGDYYQKHPDDYSGQLLKAMSIDFSGPGSLTSFEEWLVIAGALILHGDQVNLRSAATTNGVVLFADETLPEQAPTRLTLIELSHGVVLAGLYVYTVKPPGPVGLTMGAGGPGQSVQFAVHADFVRPQRGQFGVPKGRLKNYVCIFSVPYGPAANVTIYWASASLQKYGQFTPAPSGSPSGGPLGTTNSSGIAPDLSFQTGQDPGHGHGKKMTGAGNVAFTADLRASANAQCSRNGQPVRVQIFDHGGLVAVNVTYHVPSYMVSVNASVACGTVHGTVKLDGDLTGTFDDPSSLSGTGSYAVVGTGTTSPARPNWWAS
jgi:hypothetical protein